MKSPKKSAQRSAVTPLSHAGRRTGEILATRTGPKKFTEPVALSSTSPVNLRLPPTALGSGFDLLALRARCKREATHAAGVDQGARERKRCTLRSQTYPLVHVGRNYLWITAKCRREAHVSSSEACSRKSSRKRSRAPGACTASTSEAMRGVITITYR